MLDLQGVEYYKQIKIMGVNYKVYFFNLDSSYLGLTDIDNKRILLRKDQSKKSLKETIYHELIHAYLYECGLLDYYSDEVITGWLGKFFTKIHSQFKGLIYENNRK